MEVVRSTLAVSYVPEGALWDYQNYRVNFARANYVIRKLSVTRGKEVELRNSLQIIDSTLIVRIGN